MHICIICKYVNNSEYESQIGPCRSSKASFEIFCEIMDLLKYARYVILTIPRVRLTGHRSSAAVDMFGRAPAVTFTRVWSGHA